MQNTKHLIEQAIQHHGSQARLAAAMDCSQQQISYLLKAKSITAEMALKIHAVTDGAVSKHALRPDIFGPLHPNTDESAPDTGAGQPIQMTVNKPGVNYDQP